VGKRKYHTRQKKKGEKKKKGRAQTQIYGFKLISFIYTPKKKKKHNTLIIRKKRRGRFVFFGEGEKGRAENLSPKLVGGEIPFCFGGKVDLASCSGGGGGGAGLHDLGKKGPRL